MDKTQVTPIQELISLYEENITGDSNDLVIKACINVAKRLLPTERQFSETCFDAGRHYQSDVISFDMGGIRTITEPDFYTFFKQYSND